MKTYRNSAYILPVLVLLLLSAQSAHSQMPTTAEGFTIKNQAGETVTLKIPSSGVSPYSLLFPQGPPVSGSLLFGADGNGQLSWLTPGTNGQVLQIVGGAPLWQDVNVIPDGTTSNTTLVWNGSQWVENTNVTMDPATGNTTIGGDLTVGGTSVNLPNNSIDNNELANSSINVTYGSGLSGGASVALGGTLNLQNTGVTEATAGTGIGVSGSTGNVTITNTGVTGATAGTGIDVSGGTGNVTITNTGVTSISGTANQVNVSGSTGSVTLSTPQDIHTGASPTFAGLTLNNLSSNNSATQVLVSNGGVIQTRSVSSLGGGSTSLNHNSMWVGNASNQAAQLNSTGVYGAVLQLNNAGSPNWSNDLDVHNVQISSMLTVNGNQVNKGDVTFDGNNFNVHAQNSTFDGRVTLNGETTVSGTFTTNNSATLNSGVTVNGGPVNFPNNSIDNNELANSSINVSYGSGLSGSSSVALGGTLNLQNTGVTRLTAGNGITLSGNTGDITISSSNSGGLSSVSRNNTLTGNGTSGSPLGINLSNANSWTAAQTFSSAIINGGSINGTSIGSSSPSSATFTTLGTTGSTTLGNGGGDNVSMNLTGGGTLNISGLTQDDNKDRVLVQATDGRVYYRSASSLGGSSGWSLTGNSGTTAGTNFLGTTDNQAMQIRVNNQRVMQYEPNGTSPNIIGGHANNSVSLADDGNVIAGGGTSGSPNYMNVGTDFGFIGGGFNNRILASSDQSVIGGGESNTIDSDSDGSVIAGGRDNTISSNSGASDNYSAIPGGRGLTLNGLRSFGFLAGNGSGNKNMTVSDDDVAVFGNADLWLANNDNDATQLRFYEPKNSSGSYPGSAKYSSFEAQSQSSSISYLLPDTAGVTGDVLAVKSISGGNVTLDWTTTNSTGAVGTLVFARKTADETTSNTSLQNDDHLTLALKANTTYEINGALYIKRSNGNGQFDVAWDIPNGATMLISFFANESKSGNSNTGADIRDQDAVGQTTNNNGTYQSIGINTNWNMVYFRGLVVMGANDGDIKQMWCPSGGGTATVYKNSYIGAKVAEM